MELILNHQPHIMSAPKKREADPELKQLQYDENIVQMERKTVIQLKLT